MNNQSLSGGEQQPVLRVANLKKHFSAHDPPWIARKLGIVNESIVRAVDGVSFEIGEDEIVGVIGESGCGKSTLGKSLLRLIEPSSGDVFFKGESITDLSREEMRLRRKDMQIVFQDPSSSLNPRLKIGNLIKEPLKNFGTSSPKELDARVDELLEQVNLPTSFKNRYPHELSGGQLQRILICRAIATEPDLLIADEPVTGLDVSIQSQIIELFKKIQSEYGMSILFIAHDLSVVRHISDRVMVLYLGKIVEMGKTEDVFDNPQHPYTRSLKDAIPGSDYYYEEVENEPPSPANPPSGCSFHPRCPAYIGDVCKNTDPALVQLQDGRDIACHHFEGGGSYMESEQTDVNRTIPSNRDQSDFDGGKGQS